ncbi:putative nephrin-like isoform X7 [Penaeus vannamei]|uniref:Putative nephrin-like isoform X7 n=1 Tax=Penaeus vannamei TaxID=6689 RepID=A0A3R7PDK5_PENVA|nr:putative nephrin-like isoform X7 [Penaeus vannamei]
MGEASTTTTTFPPPPLLLSVLPLLLFFSFSLFFSSSSSLSRPVLATFLWRLNGSDRTYTSKSEQLAWGHLVSQFTFVGTSDKDYGALMCWANNSIGKQEKPCVFQIIPAGPPSSPEHCEIINNTAENIEVLCEHGFDGGMRQSFLAEVYDEGGSLHLNRSSDEPQWSVESLRPGTSYTIRISAFNAKGRSPIIILTAATLKVAEQRVVQFRSLSLYSSLPRYVLGRDRSAISAISVTNVTPVIASSTPA